MTPNPALIPERQPEDQDAAIRSQSRYWVRRGKCALVTVAALALLSCTTATDNRPAFYSEEIDANIWSNLKAFGEPELDRPASSRIVARYRLSTHGIRCLSYVIRLDETEKGRVNGSIKSRSGCGRERFKPVRSRAFVAERNELRELDGLFSKAGMFREYSEKAVGNELPPNSICIDGIELLFERRNAEGYRTFLANDPCSATDGVMLAAEKFVEIAGAEEEGVF